MALWRIHWHWTAGAAGVIAMEKDSYNEVISNDGSYTAGKFPVEAQIPPLRPGNYAAHTLGANSYAIGLSIDAMAGAVERPLNWGTNPMTEAAIQTLVERTAYYCKKYAIPVSRHRVLSHAEVERTLGIKQNQKWDITVLPGMTRVDDAIVVGDELRARVVAFMKGEKPKFTAPAPMPAAPVTLPTAPWAKAFAEGTNWEAKAQKAESQVLDLTLQNASLIMKLRDARAKVSLLLADLEDTYGKD
jgi:hypothetical protein